MSFEGAYFEDLLKEHTVSMLKLDTFVFFVPWNKLLVSLRTQLGSGMSGTDEIHLDLSCKASIKVFLCCAYLLIRGISLDSVLLTRSGAVFSLPLLCFCTRTSFQISMLCSRDMVTVLSYLVTSVTEDA